MRLSGVGRTESRDDQGRTHGAERSSTTTVVEAQLVLKSADGSTSRAKAGFGPRDASQTAHRRERRQMLVDSDA